MKKVSLLIKITTLFVFVSVLTVSFLYITFSTLFEQYMLQTEKEKVILIAETIEPMVAMNAYLGLNEELGNLAQQIANRKFVIGGELAINNKSLWLKEYDENIDHIHVDYPVKDPLTANQIGNIHIAYSLDAFNQAAGEMRQKVIIYLAVMSVLFLTFVLVIRYLLRPLSIIAQRVKSY